MKAPQTKSYAAAMIVVLLLASAMPSAEAKAQWSTRGPFTPGDAWDWCEGDAVCEVVEDGANGSIRIHGEAVGTPGAEWCMEFELDEDLGGGGGSKSCPTGPITADPIGMLEAGGILHEPKGSLLAEATVRVDAVALATSQTKQEALADLSLHWLATFGDCWECTVSIEILIVETATDCDDCNDASTTGETLQLSMLAYNRAGGDLPAGPFTLSLAAVGYARAERPFPDPARLDLTLFGDYIPVGALPLRDEPARATIDATVTIEEMRLVTPPAGYEGGQWAPGKVRKNVTSTLAAPFSYADAYSNCLVEAACGAARSDAATGDVYAMAGHEAAWASPSPWIFSEASFNEIVRVPAADSIHVTATFQVDEAYHKTMSLLGSSSEGVTMYMVLEHSRCLDLYYCAKSYALQVVEPARCLTCVPPYISRLEATHLTLTGTVPNELGGPMPPGDVQILFVAYADVGAEARFESQYADLYGGTNSAFLQGRLVSLVVDVDPAIWPPR